MWFSGSRIINHDSAIVNAMYSFNTLVTHNFLTCHCEVASFRKASSSSVKRKFIALLGSF